MPLKQKAISLNEKLVRAVSHPVRVKAFVIMAERPPASSKQIAEELGEDLSNVGYHVRELARLEMIELVDTKQRRGAVEKFYRAIERPLVTEADWETMHPAERAAFSTYVVQLVMMDISRSIDAGRFDLRTDRHLSRAPLLVDAEGWRELAEIHADALYRTLDVQARAAGRMAEGGEEGFHVYSTSMLFEAANAGMHSGTGTE